MQAGEARGEIVHGGSDNGSAVNGTRGRLLQRRIQREGDVAEGDALGARGVIEEAFGGGGEGGTVGRFEHDDLTAPLAQQGILSAARFTAGQAAVLLQQDVGVDAAEAECADAGAPRGIARRWIHGRGSELT